MLGSTALRHIAALIFVVVALPAFDRSAQASWIPDGAPIVTWPDEEFLPAIASDGAGGAIIVWAESRFGDPDIFAQRIDSTGAVRWISNGVPVCMEIDSQTAPVAVSDNAGGVVIVWQDHRGAESDLYGQRLNSAGVRQWITSGVPLCTASGFQNGVAMIRDGNVGVFTPPGYNLVWADTRHSAPGEPNVDLYAQHLDLTGAGLWTTAAAGGVPVCTENGNQTPPVMVTDNSGGVFNPSGAVIAWRDERNLSTGDGGDIRAQRIDALGTALWGASVAVCDTIGFQDGVVMVALGAGNSILAWDDDRALGTGSGQDIYAQKLNSAGAGVWPKNGVPVCSAPGQQIVPRMVIDGAGGGILAWSDHRTSGTSVDYAQRIDGNGQALWAPNGIPMTLGPSDGSPAMLGDGAGGAILVYTSAGPNGSTRIFAQRVDGNGNLVWNSAGVPVCVGQPFNRQAVVLAPTGSLGAIAAWQDTRALNNDIYAMRMTAVAGTAAIDLEMPRASRLAFLSANPARGDVRLALELAEPAAVHAEVIDTQGRRVRMLADGARMEPGRHELRWDGADDSGAPVPSGIYWVRARAGAWSGLARVVELR